MGAETLLASYFALFGYAGLTLRGFEGHAVPLQLTTYSQWIYDFVFLMRSFDYVACPAHDSARKILRLQKIAQY